MNWLVFYLVLLLILYVLVVWYGKKWLNKRVSTQDKAYFVKHWQGIKKETGASDKIFMADKLLDEMLKRKGVTGSMGDKLKKSSKRFTDLNGLWNAHRLRNKLAHEVGFKPSNGELEKAMKSFEKAFKDLGLML